MDGEQCTSHSRGHGLGPWICGSVVGSGPLIGAPVMAQVGAMLGWGHGSWLGVHPRHMGVLPLSRYYACASLDILVQPASKGCVRSIQIWGHGHYRQEILAPDPEGGMGCSACTSGKCNMMDQITESGEAAWTAGVDPCMNPPGLPPPPLPPPSSVPEAADEPVQEGCWICGGAHDILRCPLSSAHGSKVVDAKCAMEACARVAGPHWRGDSWRLPSAEARFVEVPKASCARQLTQIWSRPPVPHSSGLQGWAHPCVHSAGWVPPDRDL